MSRKKAIKKKAPVKENTTLAKIELTEDEKGRLDNYKERLKNKPFLWRKEAAMEPQVSNFLLNYGVLVPRAQCP